MAQQDELLHRTHSLQVDGTVPAPSLAPPDAAVQPLAFFTGDRLGTGAQLQGPHQLTHLLVLYGIGYTAMCATLSGLNAHGLRRRGQLALDEYEVFFTRVTIWQWVLLGAPGLVSALAAALAPVAVGVWAGFADMILPVITPSFGMRVARRARTRFADRIRGGAESLDAAENPSSISCRPAPGPASSASRWP